MLRMRGNCANERVADKDNSTSPLAPRSQITSPLSREKRTRCSLYLDAPAARRLQCLLDGTSEVLRSRAATRRLANSGDRGDRERRRGNDS
jgi:hypothetical protein